MIRGIDKTGERNEIFIFSGEGNGESMKFYRYLCCNKMNENGNII